MADQVELLFQFNTQGASQLDTVEKIVQELGKSSALTGGQINIVEQALAALTKSGKTAQEALAMVAGSSASVGKEAAGAAKALLEEAAASTAVASASTEAATGIRSVATASGQAVSSVTAASAALRGLEGSLNIRAAERFLTQFSGINSLLQGTFQIFGALALTEFAVRGVEELAKFYNAMNPVIEAEKEYTRAVEEAAGQSRNYTPKSVNFIWIGLRGRREPSRDFRPKLPRRPTRRKSMSLKSRCTPSRFRLLKRLLMTPRRGMLTALECWAVWHLPQRAPRKRI